MNSFIAKHLALSTFMNLKFDVNFNIVGRTHTLTHTTGEKLSFLQFGRLKCKQGISCVDWNMGTLMFSN